MIGVERGLLAARPEVRKLEVVIRPPRVNTGLGRQTGEPEETFGGDEFRGRLVTAAPELDRARHARHLASRPGLRRLDGRIPPALIAGDEAASREDRAAGD